MNEQHFDLVICHHCGKIPVIAIRLDNGKLKLCCSRCNKITSTGEYASSRRKET
jgi:hypothetical protein